MSRMGRNGGTCRQQSSRFIACGRGRDFLTHTYHYLCWFEGLACCSVSLSCRIEVQRTVSDSAHLPNMSWCHATGPGTMSVCPYNLQAASVLIMLEFWNRHVRFENEDNCWSPSSPCCLLLSAVIPHYLLSTLLWCIHPAPAKHHLAPLTAWIDPFRRYSRSASSRMSSRRGWALQGTLRQQE